MKVFFGDQEVNETTVYKLNSMDFDDIKIDYNLLKVNYILC